MIYAEEIELRNELIWLSRLKIRPEIKIEVTFDVSGGFGHDPQVAIGAGQVVEDTDDEVSVNIFSASSCIL